MKKLNTLCIITYLSLFLGTVNVLAQPEIQWEKSLGGTQVDRGISIQQTADEGFIMAGETHSEDGDVSNTYGSGDAWLVKMDMSGNIQWEKAYGGGEGDAAYAIDVCSDGGYIFAGRTMSSDGDVSGYHNFDDAWVVRTDANGNILWQNPLGGSLGERAYSIEQTIDGGFIVAGYSNSSDGDVSANNGSSDVWVVKLDVNGNVTWETNLGGTDGDVARSVKQTADGGYIVGASTWSSDIDILLNHGVQDYWIIRLNSVGTVLWQKTYGGSAMDILWDLQTTSDGGYIACGQSGSNDGDVTGNHGGSDYWILKLDAVGNIQWEKSIGGSELDRALSIKETANGEYIIAGLSQSTDGDATGNTPSFGGDIWVVDLDGSGNLLWHRLIVGPGAFPYEVNLTEDSGYILIGTNTGAGGDVSFNHGQEDCWAVKLSCGPNITCPSDIIVSNDPGICGATVYFGEPSVIANCSTVGINQMSGPENGSVFPVGTTLVSFLATDGTGSTATCSFTVTVTSDLTANAGSDQIVIIDNGPGPDPYPCDTLEASASGGTPPYSHSWAPATGLSDPNAANTDVCPNVTTTYTLTVTDANGCESTDEVTVTVIDIDDTGSLPLVGNNSNKVYVCHLATCETVEANIQANCNSPHSLCAHLSHGDELGECACKNGNGEAEVHVHDLAPHLNAYPNPFTNTTTLTFSVDQDCRATLSVFDITGKEVARLFDGDATKEKLHVATLNGNGLGSGIYFYTLQTDYGESFTRKLVLSR